MPWFFGAEGESTSVQVIYRLDNLRENPRCSSPYQVWHRTVARRVLPANSLAKPTLVEVQAASADSREEAQEELVLKYGLVSPRISMSPSSRSWRSATASTFSTWTRRSFS